MSEREDQVGSINRPIVQRIESGMIVRPWCQHIESVIEVIILFIGASLLISGCISFRGHSSRILRDNKCWCK